MDSLPTILGISVVCFLVAYVAFKLDKEKHEHLQAFLVMIFFFLLLFIPQTILEYNDKYCSFELNTTQNYYVYGNNFTSYHWDYTGSDPVPVQIANDAFVFHTNITNHYNRFCVEQPYKTPQKFFTAVLWIVRIIQVYLIIFLIIYLYGHLRRVV